MSSQVARPLQRHGSASKPVECVIRILNRAKQLEASLLGLAEARPRPRSFVPLCQLPRSHCPTSLRRSTEDHRSTSSLSGETQTAAMGAANPQLSCNPSRRNQHANRQPDRSIATGELHGECGREYCGTRCPHGGPTSEHYSRREHRSSLERLANAASFAGITGALSAAPLDRPHRNWCGIDCRTWYPEVW